MNQHLLSPSKKISRMRAISKQKTKLVKKLNKINNKQAVSSEHQADKKPIGCKLISIKGRLNAKQKNRSVKLVAPISMH